MKFRSGKNPENAYYVEPRSGERYPLDFPRWCADGPKPLMINPQTGISRDEIDRGTRSLWRYQASLPVEIARPISLGEGCTPLVQRDWNDFRPFFKLEWFNPTCSFKDRGTTVMLSYVRQFGIDAFPGRDFQREIDRAVGQRLIGRGAERHRLETALAAIVADDGRDQRVFPGAAEAAIGQAVEVLRALDGGAVGIEDDAAGLRLDDGIDGLQVGAGALLRKQAERT